MRWTLFLLLTTMLACGSDDGGIPVLPDDDLKWDEVTYLADETPMVAQIPAREDWMDATFPLNVEGKADSGKEGILYGLSLGHYWLLKNQLPDANYLYDWDAGTGESTDGKSRLQMMATAWSQVVVYRFLQREEFLLAPYRVVQNYLSDIQRVENADGEMMAHVSGRLNETAFMFYVLIELESMMKTGEFSETITEMGRFFANQVDENGCIFTSANHATSCESQHSSFPVGQGMVAMERLYRETGDEMWLDLLEKSTGYYYEFMNREDQNTLDPYWLAWAGPPMVSSLIARPNAEHEAWIFEMADYRVGDQYVEDAVPSYMGGFKKRSGRAPSWSAVSYVEGILDAHRLAKARGDETRVKRYRQSGILAARYLLSLQYREANVGNWELADPDRAIGAFHFANHANASSISMHYIRTDYMDHMAITLTKALTFLDLPETYPGPGLAVAPVK